MERRLYSGGDCHPPAYARTWLSHPFGGLRLYIAPSAHNGTRS